MHENSHILLVYAVDPQRTKGQTNKGLFTIQPTYGTNPTLATLALCGSFGNHRHRT